jgi:hypothetical protein
MLKLSKLNIQTRSDKPTVLAVAIKLKIQMLKLLLSWYTLQLISIVSRFIAVAAGSINVARCAIYTATVDIQSYEHSLPS